MIPVIFIDTNVILDVLLQREPNAAFAEQVLKAAESGQVQGATSSSGFVNMIYILGTNKLPTEQISGLVLKLLNFIQILPTLGPVFAAAMVSGFTDLEDAVQYHTALQAGTVRAFVTANTKDFKMALPQLPVMTPVEFMSSAINQP